jgi:hypothetical protein
VCHNPHSQASDAWDIFAAPFGSPGGGDSGSTTATGTATTINDSSKAAFWTPDAWRNYYVRIQSSTALANVGQVRVIAGNSTSQLVVSTAFPAPVRAGDRYEIVGRHYQRTTDDMNQMCEDCHFYRVQSHFRVEGGDVAYPANGINVFSHPVGAALHANGRGYDRSAPLDVNGMPQGGQRSASGGEWPDNASNNLVLDGTNTVRCLTCHTVHYSDSNSLTVDLP